MKANVTTMAQGAGTPTGTVTFTVNNALYRPIQVSLSGGQASLDLNSWDLSVDDYSISAGFDPGSAAFVASSGNTSVSINPAMLDIVPDDQTKAYGAPLPVLTWYYIGLVNGDTPDTFNTAPNKPPIVSTTATAASHVAGSPYSITTNGAVDPNYKFVYNPGRFYVTSVAAIVRPDNQTKAYGAVLPGLTAGYSRLVNGDTPDTLNKAPNRAPTISTTATAASHVAGNPYSITAAGAVDSDYQFTYVPGYLTVTPAVARITPSSFFNIQGESIPPLTFSITGLVNGDTSASLTTQPFVTTTATATSAPGTYPIVASGAANPDYSFTYIDGSLTNWSYSQATTNLLLKPLNAAANIPNGLLNSLVAKAQAAKDSFDRGNTTAGVNQLQAFVNEIQARLKDADADLAAALGDLLTNASRIMRAISP